MVLLSYNEPIMAGVYPIRIESTETLPAGMERKDRNPRLPRIPVLVTDYGICVNPRRQDLIEQLKTAKIPLKTIEELRDLAYSMTGKPRKLNFMDNIVALNEDRGHADRCVEGDRAWTSICPENLLDHQG